MIAPYRPPARRRVPGWLLWIAVVVTGSVVLAGLISSPWWVAGGLCTIYLVVTAPYVFGPKRRRW